MLYGVAGEAERVLEHALHIVCRSTRFQKVPRPPPSWLPAVPEQILLLGFSVAFRFTESLLQNVSIIQNANMLRKAGKTTMTTTSSISVGFKG